MRGNEGRLLFVPEKVDFLERLTLLYGMSSIRATPILPILIGDMSALRTQSTALHSVPPHSLVAHLFCVLKIILWPVLFVCKVSYVFVVSLCLPTSFCLYHIFTFCDVYSEVLACLFLCSSAGFLPYKAEFLPETLPGLCSFIRKEFGALLRIYDVTTVHSSSLLPAFI